MNLGMRPMWAADGAPGEQFRAACSANDVPQALALLEQHWTTLIFDPGTTNLVFDLVGTLGSDQLAHTPRAGLIAETIGGLPHDPSRAVLPVGTAQIAQAIREGRGRFLVEAAVLTMISLRTAGRAADGVRIARVSCPLLEAVSGTRFSPAVELVGYWHLQAAQAELHAGLLSRARLDFEHAWVNRANDVTGYVGPSAAPYGVLLAALHGDTPALGRWHHAWTGISQYASTLVEADTMARPVRIADLLVASDHLDDTLAAELAAGLEPHLRYDELWPLTLFAIVRHLADIGDVGRAQNLVTLTLDQHRHRIAPGSLHETFASFARAEVALASGRLDSVAPLIGQIDAAAMPGLGSLYLARAHLAAGEIAAARRHAVSASRQATSARVRRESAFLTDACTLDRAPHPLQHLERDLRRVTSQLPESVHRTLAESGSLRLPRPRGVPSTFTVAELTPAERRALIALAGPGTVTDVALGLHLSPNTLKTQARGLYRKLGVSSRDEAVATARRHGLFG